MERKIVEYLIDNKSLRHIEKALHVGYRRVKRVMEKAREYGYLDGTVPLPQYPEAIFPDPADGRSLKQSENDLLLKDKEEWIKDRLEAGWKPITVFEELPVEVGRSSFYRFLHRNKLYDTGITGRRVIPEIVHNPGEALLLDWGKLCTAYDPMTGKNRTVWMFVGILGFSRFMMVRLVWKLDLQTTLDNIESMFRELGGVTERLTSDNPKIFATEASKYEPLLNPVFERFANHYGIKIECLPPRDPQKKGKVERPMSYIRRLFQAHGKWQGIKEAQSYMDKKIALANERKHGTTIKRPIEQFLDIEVKHLKSLPSLSYEIEQYHEGRVRKDGHVRFANKYYSVASNFIGKEVSIIANSKLVSIFYKGRCIETHERVTDPNISKSTKNNHLRPWERMLKDSSIYRSRAAAIGPDVDRLISVILEKGKGFVDTRKVWGILSLDKTFPKAVINEACKKAIELNSYSYRTVKTLANLTLAPEPEKVKPVVSLEKYKFLRSLSTYSDYLQERGEK